MTSYQEVFERKEVKYRLDAAQRHAMLTALEGRMAVDDYGTTSIVSRYFDTPDRALIERSLDKPLYKEKLRVRSYGIPGEDDQVFVELKKKFKGTVYKRRVQTTAERAEAWLSGRTPAPENSQVCREIDWFLHMHSPAPKIFIA